MSESMSTVLADRLLQTAIESNMKIGDKLPGEVELADRFHVSRVSIREAINGLKFLGMLDAAPRRGTTIAALDYRRLVKYLGFQMAFSSLSEEELFDARLALEIGMLDLVGQRMTDEDYRELLELAGSPTNRRRSPIRSRRICAFTSGCSKSPATACFRRL